MTDTTIRCSRATTPCPFEDGQLLRVTSGGFRGMIVRVDGRSSFWTPETYLFGDPKNGVYPEGWQIVLDSYSEERGEWLYTFREDAREVQRMTKPTVEQYGNGWEIEPAKGGGWIAWQGDPNLGRGDIGETRGEVIDRIEAIEAADAEGVES